MPDKKNYIFAIVLALTVLIGWELFYISPQKKQQALVEAQQEETLAKIKEDSETTPTNDSNEISDEEMSTVGPITSQTKIKTDKTPIQIDSSKTDTTKDTQQDKRIIINNSNISGSISLTGARFNHVILKHYLETLEPNSENVELFNAKPQSSYFSFFGWYGDTQVPNFTSKWQFLDKIEADQIRLNKEETVSIYYDNASNIRFILEFTIDDKFMLTVNQRIENNSANPIKVTPYGLISRKGTPELSGFAILHEGLIGVFEDNTLKEVTYEESIEEGTQTFEGQGGWLGFTDKYWLAAMIPNTDSKFVARMLPSKSGLIEVYQTDFQYDETTILANSTSSIESRLFVGAKVVSTLNEYASTGISLFDRSVDFGWYYFLTKPIFNLLNMIHNRVKNFGLSIIILTLIVRLLLFPLANKSFVSMSKMKKLQPEIVKMKSLYPDDKSRQSQEMMALYKREKVNPLSGCLPILLQIPIFFALYKVLFVTIEMRHAPFYGWIKDLSAPDPYGLITGFGILDFEVTGTLAFLNIGIWPILMGITMFLQQKLNPAPTDPIQKKIFTWMPIFFTFLLARMPAGLVIYWTASNIFSIAQQWFIMRRVKLRTR